MFGRVQGMFYEGEQSHKTTTGFFVSFVFYFCAAASVIYYYKQFTNREQKPIILIEDSNLLQAPKLNLGQADFFLTFTGMHKERFIPSLELSKILTISVD